jgi:hypothetical protein
VSAGPASLPSEDDQLCQYARRIFDLCGLRDYDVYVMPDPPSDRQALASATIDTRRRAVELRYATGLRDHLDALRHATTHEAVHAHLHALAETVEHEVGQELGRTAYRVFWRGFERDIETAVDSLANVIAPSLPLMGDEG